MAMKDPGTPSNIAAQANTYVHDEAIRLHDSLVQLQMWATEYSLRALGALLTLVIGWTVASWVSRAVNRHLVNAQRVDHTLADYAGTFIRAAILCFTAIAVLAKFGVQTTSIVGVISAASLAIGLALQGTLSNFAAGVMLLIFRPFKEGDLVELSGRLGTVRAIGIFATEIRPASGEFIVIPNGQVWGTTIINYTRNGTRRLELLIGIDYSANHILAEQRLMKLALEHPQVLDSPAPTTQLRELGDDAVIIALLAWTHAPNLSSTRLDLLSQIKLDFDAQGIIFPYPQRDIRFVAGEPLNVKVCP